MTLKVLSIWNPYSTLIVAGHKTIETRCWPAPSSMIGQRIGIAATKILRREQLEAYGKPSFQQFYRPTGLPALEELPRGAIIGTAVLAACKKMSDDMIDAVHPRERAFGIWAPGFYAWFLIEPRRLATPIPARGAQGLWNYAGDLEAA